MKKKNKKYMLVILLLLVVGVSIGYAALTTTLNINGNTKIEKATWDVHFENLQVTDGSVVATKTAVIDSDTTTINYEINLAEPGDFYEFTVDVVNAGSIDAMISKVLKEGLSEAQEKYIDYSIKYSDGEELLEKDILNSGTTKNIIVSVKYREDIVAEDLPTEEETLNLSFSVTYIQDDGTSNGEASQFGFIPTYFAYGTPTTASTTDYTTLAHYVFAGLGTDSSLGVCINDGGLFCIKNNDYENSVVSLKRHFGEDNCTLQDTFFECKSESFHCITYFNGDVYFSENFFHHDFIWVTRSGMVSED